MEQWRERHHYEESHCPKLEPSTLTHNLKYLIQIHARNCLKSTTVVLLLSEKLRTTLKFQRSALSEQLTVDLNRKRDSILARCNSRGDSDNNVAFLKSNFKTKDVNLPIICYSDVGANRRIFFLKHTTHLGIDQSCLSFQGRRKSSCRRRCRISSLPPQKCLLKSCCRPLFLSNPLKTKE